MAVSRSDYPPDAVEAAKSVLVELVHVLGEYRDDIVIVGGWVPPLLMPDSTGHVGSTDVDVALNHLAGTDEAYARISESLRANDYRQDEDQPFIWYREVDAGGENPVTVEVDFLAGEYGGRGKGHRTQHVQDLRPRKARGADLLFDDVKERDVEAVLPSGAVDSVTVRVAGVAPYIVMKSSALDTRIKQKDAYDIWFVLANYPGGMSAVVGEFTPFADHGLVLAAVAILEDKFESPNHFGPASVAEFLEQSGEEADITQRDAFERVQALLAGLREHAEDHRTDKRHEPGVDVSSGIRILQGIPPELLDEASRLLYGAFEEKLVHELRPGSPEQGLRIVTRSLDPALGWIAVDEQGSLLGVAGVSWRGRHFSQMTFRLFAEEFGFAGTMRRWPLAMLERIVARSKKLHWRIEVLVVAESARGQGIGTALLSALTEAAREAGMRTVGLEVVDVNDRALQLYERVGFTSVANLRTGWLTAGGGYRAVRIMRMELDEQR